MLIVFRDSEKTGQAIITMMRALKTVEDRTLFAFHIAE